MRQRLGVYAAPGHGLAVDYIGDVQPFMVRILDPDVMHVSRAHVVAQEAFIAPRFWWLDDNEYKQHARVLADPEGFGVENAGQQLDALKVMEQQAMVRGLPFPTRSQIYLSAVNEFPVWDAGGVPKAERRAALNRYSVAFGKTIEAAGCGAMLGCINSGHPDEWPDPDWSWFAETLAWLEQSRCSVLELHEYWQPCGPSCVWVDEQGATRIDAGALAWRHRHLKANMRIVIGECGIDGITVMRNGVTKNTGWRHYMGDNPELYARQLVEYINGCDSRVLGVLPFSTDFRENKTNAWWSFDTIPASDAIVASLSQLTEPKAFLPIVINNAQPESQIAPAPTPTGIIDPLVLQAILQIESGGTGLVDGRPVIRFEPHIFRTYLHDDALFVAHFKYGDPPWVGREFNPGDGWRTMETGGQPVQWQAYELARSFDAEAAAMATSAGAPQIMGFNHESVGYDSAQAMLQAFASEPVQVIAFINFILARPALLEAVRDKDWATIATIYNGTGNVTKYGAKLQSVYAALAGAG